jgi:HK97 family phage portal protein
MGLIQELTKTLQRQQKAVQQNTIRIDNGSSWVDHTSAVKDINFLDQFTSYTYIASRYNANSLAGHDIYLAQEEEDGFNALSDDQLQKDLLRFNSIQTLREARYLTRIYLELTGHAFWVIVEPENKRDAKAEFFVLDPTKIKIKKDKNTGEPIHYEYHQVTGKVIDIDPLDIVPFREPNPKDWLSGYGALEASRYSHNSLESMESWNMNVFMNNNKPDGYWVVPGAQNPEKRNRFASFLRSFQGSDNSRKSAVLSDSGIEFRQVMESAKDSDFIEGMRLMRENVLLAHGVDIALVFPSATNANTEQATKNYEKTTLTSMLELEKGAMNEFLLPNYYRAVDHSNKVFIFDDPVTEDRSQNVQDASLLYEKGIITRGEAKAMLDIEMGDEDDVYITDTQPLSFLSQPAVPNEEVETDDPKEGDKAMSENRSDLRKYAKGLVKDRELDFKAGIRDMLKGQYGRIINNIDGIRDEDSVSLEQVFPKVEEDSILRRELISLYTEFAERVNKESQALAVVVAKSKGKKLYNKKKQLTPQQLTEINLIAGEAISKLDDKSRKDLLIFVNQVQDGVITRDQFKSQVNGLYSSYLDGVQNTSILQRHNAYVDAITNQAIVDGRVTGSENRYNRMLELITNKSQRENAGLPSLTKEEQDAALRALKGITYNNPDPLAQTVDRLLGTLYGLTDDVVELPCPENDNKAHNRDCGIPTGRLDIITRTESNRIAGLSSRYSYENNDDVVAAEWLTANDAFVRNFFTSNADHVSADGQQVGRGEKFLVSGELLSYPSDPAGSIENTINCRCVLIPVI